MFDAKAVFITGTDTGIGKTFVSCALIKAIKHSGRTVEAMKPVASGSELQNQQWQNEDALALMQACGSKVDYALVNPYALPLATAPQIAAREANVSIDITLLVSSFQKLQAQADFVLVEGVGGWLAPLSDNLDQADLVSAFKIPVLLVVGMRLGCINHARLTEQAIQADGFKMLGWIANYCDAEFDPKGDYLDALSDVMKSHCLAKVPHNGELLFAHG